MRSLRSLLRDRRGLSAVEFGLIAPVLFAAIIGATQLGVLFFANAGLREALGEGARFATIWPRPTDAQIQSKISSSRFGLNPAYLGTPTITPGVSNSANYLDITMTYNVPLNFIFYRTRPVTLTQTRRVFVHPVITT